MNNGTEKIWKVASVIYFTSPVRDPGTTLKTLKRAEIQTRHVPNTSTERHS
jgi:hypothetical protein